MDKLAAAEINRLMRAGRNEMLAIQAQTERELERLYRKAGAKVTRLVQSFRPYWPAYQTAAMDALQADLARLLTETALAAQKIVDHALEKAMRTSIYAAQDAKGWLFGTNLHRMDPRLLAPESAVWNRLWPEAARAMRVDPDGIALSDRIWQTHRMTMTQMKRYLSEAMLEGKTNAQLAQELKKFLIYPEADLRKRYWREFFRRNPPGRGVYRSASKNVRRLLRTETSRAYRLGTALYVRENREVFRGMQWVLSDAHPEMDICDDLASEDAYGMGAGVYPEDAFPDIPHPQCICYWVPVVREDWLERAQGLL